MTIFEKKKLERDTFRKLRDESSLNQMKNVEQRFKFPGFGKIENNYSQCFQDLFVLKCLSGKRKGTYLEIGGGRVIGEACHYIDLCSFLASGNVISVCMSSMNNESSQKTDNVSMLLKYDNGTNAVINYFSNGNKSYPKENIQVFTQQRILAINNWKELLAYGVKGFSKMKVRQDKGHNEQFKLFVESVKKGTPIIPFDSIINTTKASFAAIQSLKEKKWIDIE